MKIKVSELTGTALDWAVARCEETLGYYVQPNKERGTTVWEILPQTRRYSTTWAQGGPIIERNDISFRKYYNPKKESHGMYYARICRESGTSVYWYATSDCQNTGETPLIASMRCYVESKLGKTVEVPVELLTELEKSK